MYTARNRHAGDRRTKQPKLTGARAPKAIDAKPSSMAPAQFPPDIVTTSPAFSPLLAVPLPANDELLVSKRTPPAAQPSPDPAGPKAKAVTTKTRPKSRSTPKKVRTQKAVAPKARAGKTAKVTTVILPEAVQPSAAVAAPEFTVAIALAQIEPLPIAAPRPSVTTRSSLATPGPLPRTAALATYQKAGPLDAVAYWLRSSVRSIAGHFINRPKRMARLATMAEMERLRAENRTLRRQMQDLLDRRGLNNDASV
jgi:hypothetical protein